jgi:hypothetical protein
MLGWDQPFVANCATEPLSAAPAFRFETFGSSKRKPKVRGKGLDFTFSAGSPSIRHPL